MSQIFENIASGLMGSQKVEPPEKEDVESNVEDEDGKEEEIMEDCDDPIVVPPNRHQSAFEDRPDHLAFLVRRHRESIVALGTTADIAADTINEEEEAKEGTSADESGAATPPPEKKRPCLASLAQYPSINKHFSEYQKQAPERLVEVRLREVSYYVPQNMDDPTIKTVGNQNICYFTYQFFHRLKQYAFSPADTVEDLGEWIPRKAGDVFQPYQKKPILHDINLCLKPGNTYVILGPPGCGKTTLLKAISGILPDHKKRNGKPVRGKPFLGGRIEYNGVSKEDEPNMVLSNVVGFVCQLDNHAPYLTVRETFDFAFQCRTGGRHQSVGAKDNELAKGMDSEKFTENLTIEGLDLAGCADTFVGNSDVRGVSGGQRRRVTVGEMMQGMNPVACADEISTGLDAAVTRDIVESIVTFSKVAKTTRVISLLQPGPETFSLFDEVIVLADGYQIFTGPIEEAGPYFASLGYKRPPMMDVADFLQSIPTPDGEMFFDASMSPSDNHYSNKEFAEVFKKSEAYDRITESLASPLVYSWVTGKQNEPDQENREEPPTSGMLWLHGKKKKTTAVPSQFKITYQNSLWRSMLLNLRRHMILWRRDRGYIIGKLFENIGMAVATGGILAKKALIGWTPEEAAAGGIAFADEYYQVIDAVYGALFMTTFHILLGTSTSVPDEIDGRSIHYKHHDANFYQCSAFVVGKLISTIPQRCIEITAFGIPLYWLVGLDRTGASFVTYLAILVTYTIALKMLFGILAQVLPKKADVQGWGTFVVLLMTLFGGFIVPPDAIPEWYIWIFWANPMSWALQGLLSNEFMSEKYEDVGIPADSFLSLYGFQAGRAWIGWSFVFMIPFTLLCAFILTLILRVVRIEPERAVVKKNNIFIGDNTEDARSARIIGDTPPAEKSSKEQFNLPFTPVDLTFDKLVYEVNASIGDEKLQLLNEVSGALRAGRLCALMGSSGAGKTTLMDVIAMRKTSGTITGDIKLNGFPQERVSFLRSSGYVEQFDVQQPELNVRETVTFCSRLRLDGSTPAVGGNAGKLRFVDHVLETMELTDIQKLQVGSYEEGGLSFEQRKRLAIACELAGCPSVLFLDEPTSGLDSRGALVVMRAMKRIANTGRTVCATIHQPSAAVFEMFDDLLLLMKGGNTVFFGELGRESVNLVNYFEALGCKPIENGENPAAWMLRAYSGSEAPKNISFPAAFKESEQYNILRETIVKICEAPDDSKKIEFNDVFATPYQEQLMLVNKRIWIVYLRSPAYTLTRLMIAIIYAFLIASVFVAQAYDDDEAYGENQASGILGTLFFSLIITGAGSITMAVPVMKRIRDVFYKHRASGMLEHSSLSWALMFAETPFIVMVALFFALVYYSTVGLFYSAERFFLFWAFFALSISTYSYFGQAFICLVRDIPTSMAIVGALIGTNVFFSGFIVAPQNFDPVLGVGLWIAPGRYAYEGLVVSQSDGILRQVKAISESPYFYHLGCEPGQTDPCIGTFQEYAMFFFGGKFTTDHIYMDFGVLIGFMIIARVLTWYSLKNFNYTNT